jgi:hypothetical protein
MKNNRNNMKIINITILMVLMSCTDVIESMYQRKITPPLPLPKLIEYQNKYQQMMAQQPTAEPLKLMIENGSVVPKKTAYAQQWKTTHQAPSSLNMPDTPINVFGPTRSGNLVDKKIVVARQAPEKHPALQISSRPASPVNVFASSVEGDFKQKTGVAEKSQEVYPASAIRKRLDSPPVNVFGQVQEGSFVATPIVVSECIAPVVGFEEAGKFQAGRKIGQGLLSSSDSDDENQACSAGAGAAVKSPRPPLRRQNGFRDSVVAVSPVDGLSFFGGVEATKATAGAGVEVGKLTLGDTSYAQRQFVRELSKLSVHSDHVDNQPEAVNYLGSATMFRTPEQRMQDLLAADPATFTLALLQNPLCNASNLLKNPTEIDLCSQLIATTGGCVSSQSGNEVQNQLEKSFELLLQTATSHQKYSVGKRANVVQDLIGQKKLLQQSMQPLFDQLERDATPEQKKQAMEYVTKTITGNPGGFVQSKLLPSQAIFGKLGLDISLDQFCKEFESVIDNDSRGLSGWFALRLGDKKIKDLYPTLAAIQYKKKQSSSILPFSGTKDPIQPIIEKLKVLDPSVMSDYQFGLLMHEKNKEMLALIINTQTTLGALERQKRNLEELADLK